MQKIVKKVLLEKYAVLKDSEYKLRLNLFKEIKHLSDNIKKLGGELDYENIKIQEEDIIGCVYFTETDPVFAKEDSLFVGNVEIENENFNVTAFLDDFEVELKGERFTTDGLWRLYKRMVKAYDRVNTEKLIEKCVGNLTDANYQKLLDARNEAEKGSVSYKMLCNAIADLRKRSNELTTNVQY